MNKKIWSKYNDFITSISREITCPICAMKNRSSIRDIYITNDYRRDATIDMDFECRHCHTRFNVKDVSLEKDYTEYGGD